MEVVLLWLDDLDDALFSVALAWERLRRGVLQVGLASAISLAAAELSAIATAWTPAFSAVAAASVAAWLVGTLARALHDREARRYLTAA
jgi:CHASE2 domain-containing sensor protein